MPRQNAPHSIGCWCGTQLMNIPLLASCRHSVVLKSTPIGKIVASGAESAAHKIVSDDLCDEKSYKYPEMKQ
jgi:hypothetical protein